MNTQIKFIRFSSLSISKNLTEEFGCVVTWLPLDLAVDKVCNFGDDFEKAKDVATQYDYLESTPHDLVSDR